MNNLDKPAMPYVVRADSDDVYCGFTKREQAAISLRVPMSGDEELDKMIFASRRLDIATAFIAGVHANTEDNHQLDEEYEDYIKGIAEDALQQSDALLKEAGL